MKELFTKKFDSFLWVEVEDSVFSTYDSSTKKHTFYDNKGNELDNYTRPSVAVKNTVKIDDPYFLEEIGEGFYVYTTHEVTYDMDGRYGQFGIKYINGNRLTDEIYYQVGSFNNGLCSVSLEDEKWGCIDTKGTLIIPYKFCEEIVFNKYGVADGDWTLIDRMGNEIPDTAHNCVQDCSKYNRYFMFSTLTDEQNDSIEKCGTAEDISVNIYDTKNRAYIVKGIPECRIDLYCFDGEPEVVVAAAELLRQYDEIELSRKGTILCKKDGFTTVFDFYK